MFCMERNSLPIVPGNSHNRRRRPVTRHCEALFYFLERSFLAGLTGGHGGEVVDRRERAEGEVDGAQRQRPDDIQSLKWENPS